jgi:hypothetical protein
MEFKFAQNKGSGPFPKGDNQKCSKNRVGSFKYFLFKNQLARKAQIYIKAS